MPLYEYEDKEGNLVELRRSVRDRNTPITIDGVEFRRSKSVPETLVFVIPGPTADQRFNERIRKGFYRHEEKHGSRFNGVEGLTKTQLKRVWEDKPNETRR